MELQLVWDEWKSTETLIRNLIDVASKGGNYLLNVGPTAQGLIPEPSVERLREMGEWLKINGESIYRTDAGPLGWMKWGRSTQKGHKLFLHVFDWPEEPLELPLLQNDVRKAYLLADPGQVLEVERSDSASSSAPVLLVDLPETAPDPLVSVLVLELDDDTKAPTVSTIQRKTPSAERTNANNVTWEVVFSEAVTGVGPADFTLAAPSGVPFNVIRSGSSYEVISTGTALASHNGEIALDFAAGHGNASGGDVADEGVSNSSGLGLDGLPPPAGCDHEHRGEGDDRTHAGFPGSGFSSW